MRHRRRGFTLIECLFYLGLLGVFGLIASWTTYGSLRVMRDVPLRSERVMRMDAVVQALRGDVWSAREMKASQGRLEIIQNEGSIVWAIAPEGVTRSDPDGTQRAWKLELKSGEFSTQGLHVKVCWNDGEVLLTSEYRRARLGGAK